MRNDFFKYLLIHGRKSVESETLPMTFKAKRTENLKNYRIYGNTVNGESVGDRTENLFDKNGVWINGYIKDNGELAENDAIATYTKFINVKPDTVYSFICDSSVPEGVRFNFYDSSKNFISRIFKNMNNPKVTTPSTCEYITLSVNKNQIQYLMIIEDSTAPTEYEPYGYRIPITNNVETANIYLDEPLAKSGNNADYIDFKTQKRYNSDGTEITVTLPEIAVTTGTNTLTVGTEVQPSKVYLQGHISRGDKNAE